MRLTIEMDDQGEVVIQTNEERLDVGAALLLFRLAEYKLIAMLMDTIKDNREPLQAELVEDDV
jgi:hypothetical protein